MENHQNVQEYQYELVKRKVKHLIFDENGKENFVKNLTSLDTVIWLVVKLRSLNPF